jgi:rifampin ADP-ribosylating transferase
VGNATKLKQARRLEREQNASRHLWHGGIGGLNVGDYLLPPSITGDPPSVSNHMVEARADRVYMTTDLELVRSYAAEVQSLGRRSGLYRVEPVGAPEIDPDLPAVGLSARRARVLEVVAEDIELDAVERLKRAAHYLAWDDGRPMYSPAGKIRLTKELEALGVTQGEVDIALQAWTEPDHALALLQRAFASRASAD